MAAITPVFLFSLPRSGSTLTQRVLATHSEIETASEPWVLLPFLFTRRREGVYAAYGHKLAVDAIEDFCAGLPDGEAGYREELREFALRLYARRAGAGKRYFLDKTPRYHVVSGDIIDIFPDARFVFLWRNPLAIIASIIETWGHGRWNLFKYEIDLFDGLDELLRVCAVNRDKVYCVRYEDLVTGSAEIWSGLFRYLNLEFRPDQLDEFSGVDLKGRMGDVTGRQAYRELSAEPIEKWKAVLANPLRKRWCRRYLKRIGAENLELMGYDMTGLLSQLDAIPGSTRGFASDIVAMLLSIPFRWLEPRIFADKLLRLGRQRRMYAHS